MNTIHTSKMASFESHEGVAHAEVLSPGLVLGNKWEILEHIASGGKGDVYRAHQKNLQRSVALKVLSPDFVKSFRGNAEELETEKERFRREVRAMAAIRHPNVLQVFDYDVAAVGGKKLEYLVMEYIPATLRDTIPEQGFGLDRVHVAEWITNYYLPVLQGVAAIHAAEVVHRDLKPENILLDGSIPKIADFGLARMPRQPGLTHTFHVLGTIFYMPKEQFEDGAAVDVRADIYALGKILHEAVAGKFIPQNKIIFKEVGLPPQNDVSSAEPFFRQLDAIIHAATKEDPDDRTLSAAILAEQLSTLVASARNISASGTASCRPGREKNTLYLIIAGLVFSIIVLASSHFLHRTEAEKRNNTQEAAVLPPMPGNNTAYAQASQSITSKDGTTMKLMPEGKETWLPKYGGQEETTAVGPFYMEESLVTNARFLTFLNAVQGHLTTKDDVVLLNGVVIFFLGEARESYTPVLYQNGIFVLSNQKFAHDAVVRVSGEGALVYARYYGRRLPTTVEWLIAGTHGLVSSGSPFALREWGYDIVASKENFFIFEDVTDRSALYCPLSRQKWEAFQNVGFRTVQSVADVGAGE